MEFFSLYKCIKRLSYANFKHRNLKNSQLRVLYNFLECGSILKIFDRNNNPFHLFQMRKSLADRGVANDRKYFLSITQDCYVSTRLCVDFENIWILQRKKRFFRVRFFKESIDSIRLANCGRSIHSEVCSQVCLFSCRSVC